MSSYNSSTPLLLREVLLSIEEISSELELLNIVRLLIANEKAPGGPYYTWIVTSTDRAQYPEIDIQTNRCVQFFLARNTIRLDALDTYLLENNSEPVPRGLLPTTPTDKDISRIVHILRCRFSEFSEPLRNQLEICLEKFLQDKSSEEIIILPLQVRQSIHSSIHINLSSENLDQLCVASLLLWISYTLYDGIIDKEKPPYLLPLANQCIRQFVEIIYNLPCGDSLYPLLNRLLRATDEALLSEALGLRNNNLELLDISDKSIPHALCTLAVIAHIDHSKHEHDMFPIEQYFKNYLTARQLHDDAHDWLEDWQRGYINPIAALLFSLWRKEYFVSEEKFPDVINDREILHKIFWTTGLNQSILLIRDYLDRATKELVTVTCLNPKNQLGTLIERLEAGCVRALAERDDKHRFLSEYRKNS